MIDATPYCWRIHLAQELAPKLYFHTRSLQGHRSVIFNNEGKVMYRTLEVPADWSICVGADGYPLYDVKAYALRGPPRDIVDGYFDASPVVEVLGLRTQDEHGVDLVVKVLGNVNTQCVIDSRMLINAIEGPTVEAIRHVQKRWRAKRPLLDQLRTIHVAIRPELAMWKLNLATGITLALLAVFGALAENDSVYHDPPALIYFCMPERQKGSLLDFKHRLHVHCVNEDADFRFVFVSSKRR